MRRAKIARFARWAACAALTVGAFEACSTTEDTTTLTVNGPPAIQIKMPLDSLACDNSLVVQLSLTNWFLKPPYGCGTQPQCGSVRVTLLETDGGPPLVSARAATPSVELDVTDLVAPKTSDAPNLGQVHFIRAELYGDSLLPFPASAGAVTFDQEPLSLATPADCPGNSGDGGPSAGGASGSAGDSAGASGASPTEGGATGAGNGGASDTTEGGAGGEPTTSGGAPL